MDDTIIWLSAKQVLFLIVADTVNTVFDFMYLYNGLILKFGEHDHSPKLSRL